MAQRRTPLEMFKFGIYISIPILTISIFNSPEMVQKLIEGRSYIIFPPEGNRPPKGNHADLERALRDMRSARASAPASAAPAETAPAVAELAPRKKWFGLF